MTCLIFFQVERAFSNQRSSSRGAWRVEVTRRRKRSSTVPRLSESVSIFGRGKLLCWSFAGLENATFDLEKNQASHYFSLFAEKN